MSRSVPKSGPAPDNALTQSQREMLEAMGLAVIGRKPLLILLGNTGSGRTTLFAKVMENVAADGALALSVVASPGVDIEDLLQAAGAALFPDAANGDFDDLLALMEEQLDQAGIGLLAVENASVLAPPVLNDLIAMSRSETPGGRFMQLLLSGTPELERSLARAGVGDAMADLGAIYRLEGGNAAAPGPEPANNTDPIPINAPRAMPYAQRTDRSGSPHRGDEEYPQSGPAYPDSSYSAGPYPDGPGPIPDPTRAFTPDAEVARRRAAKRHRENRSRSGWLTATAVIALLVAGGGAGLVAFPELRSASAFDSLNRGWESAVAMVDKQLLGPLRGDSQTLALPFPDPNGNPPVSGSTTKPLPGTEPTASGSSGTDIGNGNGTPAAAPPARNGNAGAVTVPVPPAPVTPAPMAERMPQIARLDPNDPALTLPPGPPQEVTEPTSGSDTGSATLPPLMESSAAQSPPTGNDQALAERVNSLVTRARAQLAQRRLTLPAGDNAYETLTRVREMAPATAAIAEMMATMEQTYRRWAAQAEQQNDWVRARHFYERAQLVNPDSADLRQRANAALQGRSLPANSAGMDQQASQTTGQPATAGQNQPGSGTPDSSREQAISLLRQPDALRRQLDTGMDPNARMTGGKTLLILAAEQGMTESLRLLLSRNANPEIQTADGATAVMYAAWAGHTAVLQALADAGADMDATNDDGKTALMAAAARGNLDAVRKLVDLGVSVDRVASHGWSALMYAANNGHDRVAQVLVDHGANPYRMDSAGNSALTLGALQGHTDVVDTLKPR